MSKYTFFGVLAVVVVAAAGLVSIVSGKMEEQQYLSRALLVEARVEAGGRGNDHATSTGASSTPTTTPDRGIHGNQRTPGLKYKLLTGTVKSVGANSFVLTMGRHKDATINLLSETKIYDRAWGSVARSSIVVGHKVSAYGVVTENAGSVSLSARIVRDLSLPMRNMRDDRDHGTSTGTTTRERGGGRENDND